MGTAERAVHRGLRIGRDTARTIGVQIRVARLAAGLSQRELGRLAQRSHTMIGRIERGATPTIDLRLIAVIGAVLGLHLAVRLYPAGDAVRDRAHLGLLERLRGECRPPFAGEPSSQCRSPAICARPTRRSQDERSMPWSRLRHASWISRRSSDGSARRHVTSVSSVSSCSSLTHVPIDRCWPAIRSSWPPTRSPPDHAW